MPSHEVRRFKNIQCKSDNYKDDKLVLDVDINFHFTVLFRSFGRDIICNIMKFVCLFLFC